MRKLFLLFAFSTYALSGNLFFNTVTKKWIGVHSIPCSKGVNSMVDARSASQWGVGSYFLGENGSCYEIIKILQGEDKTPLGGNRWAHGSYENGVVTGVYKIYGDNNKLLAEIIFKDGIKDGRAKEYYKDGILKLEEEYKNGLLHGQRVEYEFNGRPIKINFYYNNAKHGIERIYNVQGRPYEEFEYNNNAKTATHKRYFYDKDGDFSHIESYAGKVKNGSWLYYDKKGNVVKEIVYANGVVVDKPTVLVAAVPPKPTPTATKKKPIIKPKPQVASVKKEEKAVLTHEEEALFYPPINTNSTILIDNVAIFFNNATNRWFGVTIKGSIGSFGDALTDENVFIDFRIAGTNKTIETMPTGTIEVTQSSLINIDVQNGVIDGWLNTYFQNGEKKFSFYFVDGQKQGAAREFYEDGSLKVKWMYLNDKIDGLATFYYPNGNVKAIISFKDSIADGLSHFFDENGKLIKKAKLAQGKIS